MMMNLAINILDINIMFINIHIQIHIYSYHPTTDILTKILY